tara:strand:- start:754 stop:1770 length:1017 start_codon:yes stop_codon:yes gene_type:complete
MTGNRTHMIEDFLASAGWAGADHATLAEDASFRRYERVTRGAERAVLMDAPPDREDVAPFLLIARALRENGYSAPAILAEDPAHGFLLLEDFGDDTFTRLLDSGVAAAGLYRLAIDLLVDIHSRNPAQIIPQGIATYDDDLFMTEVGLFLDWYLPAVLPDGLMVDAAQEFRSIWLRLLPGMRNVPDTLVLRDFHVDNLIHLKGREGVAACGLLDFQDAVKGPVTYDVISLLEDARRDVPDDLATRMRERYLSDFPQQDPAEFGRSCAILGAQRHCKVLGIFTRLRDRDGKNGYLRHVPRLWRLLERAAGHPAMTELRAWLDEHVPADRRIVPPDRKAS